MAKSRPKESVSTNRLQWFFFVIIIPVIFAVTLTWIVLMIAGINLGDMAAKYGKDVPVVQSLFPSEEEKSKEQRINKLQYSLDEKNDTIDQLEQDIAGKNATIEELEQQVGDLEAKLSMEESTDENKDAQVKQVSSSFKDMDPGQAAAIIGNLDQPVAVTVLRNLPNSERGNILGELDPEQAATLTSLLITRGN
ncbi:Flagellar motility protein MotE, a chaperone for MotC folding [Thalassobacillus cyri]|uniref:Flagellar motility protein MotE, a chaperone for MotC folding n=1 Tax=Thalassobacillus cyri TaxID=571932 RepID=A0A1H4G151_9BACI|nr:MotE family protein [Thalassobacillus cyri]SEB03295.1 Flagellar motility protein MotE, a chaperone for MotC folding [Thalassobacillus cyri]